ncbi:MAG: OmpH family outer membrane protein [Bacteroidetes bacterium]|nr:OmpH family outer membrane protein [Bacteroidota bacterium]MBL6962505.1 OmpH family outer membrane protein [Bacteroidota bacterium]
MKSLKIIGSVFFITLLSSTILFSQSFSYVDSEYILEKIPEYKSAQKQLDELAEKWKADIRMKVDEIDKLYKAYQAEQVLLPDEIRNKREDEILKKEDELNKLKETRFGKEGDLFKKRKELIKPIQDKVFDAIQKLAQDEGIDFVFDKSGAVTMLFVNAKYDRSDEVLEILGIENIEK